MSTKRKRIRRRPELAEAEILDAASELAALRDVLVQVESGVVLGDPV